MALTKITAGGLADNSVVTASVADSQITLAKTTGVQTGWVKITQGTSGNTADRIEIDFSTGSTYDHYMLTLENVTCSVDSRILAQFKLGGSYATGDNYTWRVNRTSSGSYSGDSGGSEGSIHITDETGSDTGESLDAQIFFASPDTTNNRKKIWWFGNTAQNNGTSTFMSGVGGNSATTAMTGIRILSSSGNLERGTFTLYGLIK